MCFFSYLQITENPKRLKFIKQTIDIENVNKHPMQQVYLKKVTYFPSLYVFILSVW
jgi:hypothetical protein